MGVELDRAITLPYAAFITGFYFYQNGHHGHLHVHCELSPGGCGYVLVDYDPPYSPSFDCMTNFVQLPLNCTTLHFWCIFTHIFETMNHDDIYRMAQAFMLQ